MLLEVLISNGLCSSNTIVETVKKIAIFLLSAIFFVENVRMSLEINDKIDEDPYANEFLENVINKIN